MNYTFKFCYGWFIFFRDEKCSILTAEDVILMKCQICRENNAHIVFTKIVNNEKIVLHICAECAKKKGLTIELGESETYHQKKVPITNSMPVEKSDESSETGIICDSCGLSYSEFQKIGFFGCERCHQAFGEHIVNVLKQIHGSVHHEGKIPLGLSGEIEIKNHLRNLRLRLQRCVDSEEYERAAELRDKITSIEGKIVKNDS